MEPLRCSPCSYFCMNECQYGSGGVRRTCRCGLAPPMHCCTAARLASGRRLCATRTICMPSSREGTTTSACREGKTFDDPEPRNDLHVQLPRRHYHQRLQQCGWIAQSCFMRKMVE